jgi:hypothetical protein
VKVTDADAATVNGFPADPLVMVPKLPPSPRPTVCDPASNVPPVIASVQVAEATRMVPELQPENERTRALEV